MYAWQAGCLTIDFSLVFVVLVAIAALLLFINVTCNISISSHHFSRTEMRDDPCVMVYVCRTLKEPLYKNNVEMIFHCKTGLRLANAPEQ